MTDLNLFQDDDGNVYVAQDLDHAKELWVADTGEPIENAGDWMRIPNDRLISVDDENGKTVKMTIGEYAKDCTRPGCIGSFNG